MLGHSEFPAVAGGGGWRERRSQEAREPAEAWPGGACQTLPFVTKQKRCGQMQGRRPGKTGSVFAGTH